MTVCGNCGTSQGPFERLVLGTRCNQRVLITCGVSGRKKYRDLKPEAKQAYVKACLKRRAKLEGD